MFTNRTEAKQLVEQYKQRCAIILNKPCTITFDRHTLEHVVITDIQLAKTTGLKNAPDKRITEDGKNKSPFIFELIAEQGTLQFVLDDTQVCAVMNGIRFTVGNTYNVDIRIEP